MSAESPGLWQPCPRCQSARVCWRASPHRGLALVCLALAAVSLPAGLLLPCLWLVTFVLGIGAVSLWQGQGTCWECLDCRHRWAAPPPGHAAPPSSSK